MWCAISTGQGPYHAALDGAREVTFAATAASVAVIAIFLPVAFMEGVIGRFFYQFGITVTAAVALSLLEAITLTPMRLSQMMVRGHSRAGWSARQPDLRCHRAGLSRDPRPRAGVACHWWLR
jgi:multidrug efflux pump subunit AcrB